MTASIEEWKRRYETARLAHEEVRAEVERLTSLAQLMGEERDRAWTEHLIEREDLKAEIDRIRAVVDRTQSRESEYLALIEKHATEVERLKQALLDANKFIYESGMKLGEAHTEIERLKAERHTVKQMLQDLLSRHGPSLVTPHYGLGRGGMRVVKDDPA